MEWTTYQSADSEVGQAVVVLGDEEAHGAVLAAEGVVLDDDVEATGELGHVEGFEVDGVVDTTIGLTDGESINILC